MSINEQNTCSLSYRLFLSIASPLTLSNMPKLKVGKTYRIAWIDAAQSAEWTSKEELQKMILESEKGVEQILTFIKESDEFYAFTTGTHIGDGNYCDVMLIPKDWVSSIKQLRI